MGASRVTYRAQSIKFSMAAAIMAAVLIIIPTTVRVEAQAQTLAQAQTEAQAPLELTLENALQLALENHPSIVAGRDAVAAAERALKKASAAYSIKVDAVSRPLATIGKSYNEETGKILDIKRGEARLNTSLSTIYGVSGSVSLSHSLFGQQNAPTSSLQASVSAGLDPSSILYNQGRLSLATQTAQLSKAIWDQDALIKKVLIETISTYWQLELEAMNLEITREQAAEKEAAYRSVMELMDKGVATNLEVLTAQIEMRDAQLALRKSETSYVNKLANFLSNLGWKVDMNNLPTPVPSGGARLENLASSFDAAVLAEAMVNSSLDLKKKQLDLELTRLRVSAAKADLSPSISLSASYSIPNLYKSDSSKNSWAVSVNVEYPILDGGTRRLTMEERELDLDNAVAALQKAEETVIESVKTMLENWEQAVENLAIAQLKLEKARLEESIKTEHHRLGIVSQTALAATKRATRLAEINLQAAINACYIIELEIAAATGDALLLNGRRLLP
ncbi:MAG TPA: TolC family protein [Firmicutes bacterium]|nr:TolC family protein [Bacillota bacterium]